MRDVRPASDVAHELAGWRKATSELYEVLSRSSSPLRKPVIIFLLLVFVPIGVSAARYRADGLGSRRRPAWNKHYISLLLRRTPHVRLIIADRCRQP